MAEPMTDPDETFDMSGSQVSGPYQPLVFATSPSDVGTVRRVVSALLNWWGSKELTRQEWRTAGQLEIRSAKGVVKTSFDDLCACLATLRRLDADGLGLESPNGNWMDASVAMGQLVHAPSNQHERHMLIQLPQGLGMYAEAIPALDREGVAFSNIILPLQARIVKLRLRLVDHSGGIFQLDGDWHEGLAGYLNACVSLVEATLSRIFHRARHQGASIGWRLDREKCTSARQVPRDKQMFAWLSSVIRKSVTDKFGDYPRFERLREVRHHLQHFDPPAFAMTIEDAADWLNLSHSVASLVLSIREGLGLPPSLPLVELLLAPTVNAVPRAPALRRFPQPSTAGYRSCRAERPLRP